MKKLDLCMASHARLWCFPSFQVRRFLLIFFIALGPLLYSYSSYGQILSTNQLSVARQGHTATLLNNGMILVYGGANEQGPVTTAEIVDPVSGQVQGLLCG